MVAQELPAAAWQHVTWRQGRRGPQRSRFGVIQVWVAHGWREQQHPPRVAEWLLVEWPQDALEPVKYGLAACASQPPDVRHVGRIAKARWRIARDDRELQEALGLDPDEGRHGLGWRIFFYANEGKEPAHVHGRKGEKNVNIGWIVKISISMKSTPIICHHAIGGKSRKSSSSISNTLSNNWTSFSGGICDETISPSDRSAL